MSYTPQRYFTGLWRDPLTDDHPTEDRPAYNGTDDAARGYVPYATRIANQARYSNTSTPVRGLYGYGYSTIIADGAPVYIIPTANHSTRRVTWMTNNGAGPPATDTAAAGLQTKLAAVPIPVGPNGERFEVAYGRGIAGGQGADQQAVIYNPYTGEMWEFWLLKYNATLDRYECGYAGYTVDARTAPEALPNQWGARATSLPLVGGLVLQSEIAEGEIRHPVGIALPVIKSGYIPPATRQDAAIVAHTVGGDDRDAVPEGAWFRLPAGYPIDGSKPQLWRMLVMAARDYGIIVTDGTGGATTISLDGPQSIGTPYYPLAAPMVTQTANGGPLWGSAGVLNTFPWSDLVQVKYAAPTTPGPYPVALFDAWDQNLYSIPKRDAHRAATKQWLGR